MTTNDDEGATTMDQEQLAAIKRAAAQRRRALRARDEASAVLADAARTLVAPAGPVDEAEFARLAGVARSTVRGWIGKDPMNRPRRAPVRAEKIAADRAKAAQVAAERERRADEPD